MHKERESSLEIYHSISDLLSRIDDKKAYVKESIIPRMEQRRGRSTSLTGNQVRKKLFSFSPKPGEEHELAQTMVNNEFRLATGPTPDFALEVADLVYYQSQPNADDKGLAKLGFFLDGILGISKEHAFSFCIVKYETRLVHGDNPDYKEMEKEVMTHHLANSPELLNLWPSQI